MKLIHCQHNLITGVLKLSLNAHTGVSRTPERPEVLKFGLSLHLHPYIVYQFRSVPVDRVVCISFDNIYGEDVVS